MDSSMFRLQSQLDARVRSSGQRARGRLLSAASYFAFTTSAGELFILMAKILRESPRSRKSIGIVPQDTVLFNDSIRYNLLYGCPSCMEAEMIGAVQAARIYDLIQSLPNGFDTEIGERGLKLSGGEKQRIAIARLILKNPSVVVLDEATSSLDKVTEKSVHEALEVACKGRTTLTVAHRLSTMSHADEILVLQKGVIVERGTHDSLLGSEGVYHQLWNRQSREIEEDTTV